MLILPLCFSMVYVGGKYHLHKKVRLKNNIVFFFVKCIGKYQARDNTNATLYLILQGSLGLLVCLTWLSRDFRRFRFGVVGDKYLILMLFAVILALIGLPIMGHYSVVGKFFKRVQSFTSLMADLYNMEVIFFTHMP